MVAVLVVVVVIISTSGEDVEAGAKDFDDGRRCAFSF